MAASLFRFIGGAARNMIVSNVLSMFVILVIMVLGGFLLSRGKYSTFLPFGQFFFVYSIFLFSAKKHFKMKVIVSL